MKLTKHPLLLGPGVPPMPIDPAVIERLERSFRLLATRAEDFSNRFYERLFTLHPTLRAMFPQDMTRQRQKLVESLAFVVAHLRNPDAERKHLTGLGERHVGYGARPEHYPIVCQLMLQAMAEAGAPDWTPELTAEWAAALRLVADAMQAGKPAASQAHPPKIA